MQFGMKVYEQRNEQVFNLSIYLPLPYMFWAFFNPLKTKRRLLYLKTAL
jgi:hypothetical protein